MSRIALFFALLLCCYGCDSSTMIANRVPAREANEIVVLLSSQGIQAEKVPAASSQTGGGGEQMWNITVPSRLITDALAILNSAGLPRVKGTSLLDLFGNQGLVPSEMQNKIRYQEGLSEQLATTVRKMDGIIDANVQITFPQEDEEEIVMTASVYVKHRGVLDNPNSVMTTKIKRLISSAVPGLTVENVSVISDRALFADITAETLQELEGHEYISVWGVLVAKSSTKWFRTILFSFMILMFLFACIAIWMIWKSMPIISKKGFGELFNTKPFSIAEDVVEEEEVTEAEEGE